MTPTLVIFCGAGTSVDAGLPVFRNTHNALWNNCDVTVVCNYFLWKKIIKTKGRADYINQFYHDFFVKVKRTKPTEFHYWVKDLIDKKEYNVQIITTNVDDLFEKAGIDAKRIIHLHGEITKSRCTICHKTTEYSEEMKTTNPESRCPNEKCKSRYYKTDAAFFDESLIVHERYTKANYVLQKIKHQDTMLHLGSSDTTFHLLRKKWDEACDIGCKSIRVNPVGSDQTHFNTIDLRFTMEEFMKKTNEYI